MRQFFMVFFLATACGDKSSPAPDPKQFAAMSADAKCEATRRRAQPCVSELLAQQVEAVTDQALAKELRETSSTSDEDSSIHRVNCRASATYVDAVVACWTAPDCKAFATCVMKKDVDLDLRAKPPSLP